MSESRSLDLTSRVVISTIMGKLRVVASFLLRSFFIDNIMSFSIVKNPDSELIRRILQGSENTEPGNDLSNDDVIDPPYKKQKT